MNKNIKYSQNFLTSEKVLNQIIKQFPGSVELPGSLHACRSKFAAAREACMPAGRYEQLIYIIHVIGSYK